MCACFSVQIPSDMIHVCQFSYLENANPVPHHELGQDRYGFGDFHSYINTCVNTTLKVLYDIQANQTIDINFFCRSADRKLKVGSAMIFCTESRCLV